MLQTLIFDWGDTVMRDFPIYYGPMVNWPRVAIISGIDRVLAEVSRRYTVCLATNAGDSDAGLVGAALERVAIREYFKYLFTSQELGFAKPDPEFFREIVRRLGIAPSECLMVGNDLHKDILPAKSLGMKTVWFRERNQKVLEGITVPMIATMDELIPVEKFV